MIWEMLIGSSMNRHRDQNKTWVGAIMRLYRPEHPAENLPPGGPAQDK
jgi:hypothetical protein